MKPVTRTYADLTDFLKEYRRTLAKGGVFFAPDELDAPHPEIALELEVANYAKWGPISAQLVHQDPKQGFGYRLVDVPDAVSQDFKQLMHTFDAVRTYLVEGGKFVSASAVAPAEERFYKGERGYFIPSLKGKTAALEGSLSGESFRDAVAQIALQGVTGVMVVESKGITRHGFWRDGGPVGWSTAPVQEEEVLGMLLLRSKTITQEQLTGSLELMRTTPLRQGEALMMLGVLSMQEVLAALGKQVDHILQGVMKATTGDWAFYALPGLPERMVVPPLKILPRLFRALLEIARTMNADQVREMGDANSPRFAILRDEAVQRVADMDLTNDERKIVDALRGAPVRVRDVLTRSPLGKRGTHAVIWALEDLGVVELSDSMEDADAVERIRSRIDEKRKAIDSEDPFSILGVHWTATGEEAKVAYTKALKHFAKDQPGMTEELQDQAATVRKALENAFLDIRGDDRRRAARAKVVDAERIRSSAMLLGQKGEVALERKDGRGAMICFRKAAELLPEEASFITGVQRAKKMLN